jgi:hypothetical protein
MTSDDVRAVKVSDENIAKSWPFVTTARAIAINAALEQFAVSLERVCVWTEDDDGVYRTACGRSFFFDTGTAYENHFTCCPYCGARLTEGGR